MTLPYAARNVTHAPCAATGVCPHRHRSLGPTGAVHDVGEDLLGQVAERRVAEVVTERGSLGRVDVEALNELDVRLLAHEALGESAVDPGGP